MGNATSLCMLEKEIQLISSIQIFCYRQIEQIRNEGLVAVYRKIKIIVFKMMEIPIDAIAYPLAVLIVLFVRLIRNYKLIRFGYFFAGRIGHFGFDVEYYLTEKKLGLHPEKVLDIFFWRWISNGSTANDYFAKLTKRNIKVHPFAKYLFNVNNLFPGSIIHQYLPAVSRNGSRDVQGLLPQIKPQLKFTNDENKRGWEFLKKIGLKKEDKFVCLIVRDSAYLKTYGDHFSYHNYRDSNIDTYEEASLALAEKGYWIFRMGKVVHEHFKVDNHPKIIDYANSKYRSDFLDIWLGANCFFGLTATTGMGDVVAVFRKPLALVNALPLGYINTSINSNSIWLPKKITWVANNQQLTLREQIKTGVIGFLKANEYQEAGVKIIDNSPQEIKDTVLELEQKLTDKWKTHPTDKENQKIFWDILKGWDRFPKLHGKLQSKIPDTFLRENHGWFLK